MTIGMRLGLRMGSGGGVATTITRTYAEISSSLFGPIDTARTVNRTHLLASNNTALVLYIKGTDASVMMYNVNGYGTGSGLVGVCVDDGAVTLPAGVANKFPLFTGLSDTLHKVVIMIPAGYGTSTYLASNGNPIEVTGVSPYVLTSSTVIERGAATNAVWSSPTVASGGLYVPATNITGTAAATATSAIPCVRLRAATTYLDVSTQGTHFAVSVDGAAPTYYTTGYTSGSRTASSRRITCDGVLRTYNIWSTNGAASGASVMLSVGVDSTPVAITTKRIHQFGDSITFGSGTGITSTVHTDLPRVASALGLVGSTFGISGQTSAQLATRIAAQVALTNSNVSEDIAVLAMGRNDANVFTSSDWDTTVAALLVGYAKVLVRGVLNTGTSFSTFNDSMESWVTGKADARIVYIDVDSWTGIDSPDGTHPSDAGHVTLANYCITAYATHI
jgi:GDSL-like Lipase/Acylhydrolase family